MARQEQLARWRLILGAESQPDFARMGAAPLSQEELLMDGALAAIYGGPGRASARRGRAVDAVPPPPHCQVAGGPAQPL